MDRRGSIETIIGGAGRVGTGLAVPQDKDKDVVLVDNSATAVKNSQGLDVLVIHATLPEKEIFSFRIENASLCCSN